MKGAAGLAWSASWWEQGAGAGSLDSSVKQSLHWYGVQKLEQT